VQDFVPISNVLENYFDQIDYIHQHKGQTFGVPTGFKDLDELTGGLQRSDLIILAARPGMGKTSFALNMATHASLQGRIPVGVFSLEMSRDQLVQRLICSEAGIDSHRLRTGFIEENEWGKIAQAIGELSEAPIYIDDTPGISVMELRTKARRLQAEHDIGFIVVDYLQLMQGRFTENRVQEVSEISRSLKALARELNVPVLALSQLSRQVEQRPGNRPQLSDLRDSGSIEQDADIARRSLRSRHAAKGAGRHHRRQAPQRAAPRCGATLLRQPDSLRQRGLPVLRAKVTGRTLDCLVSSPHRWRRSMRRVQSPR
jgi:replicative DNA helicase